MVNNGDKTVARLDNFPGESRFEFLQGGARKEQVVNVPFNETLLHDYCMMLNKDNNRDIQLFAIQSLDPLVDDAIRMIMPNGERFMSCFNLCEMYSVPFEQQEGQFKII